LGLGAARFGAFRGGAAAHRAAGDPLEQPAEAAAATRFQQFDRVDPELQEQLFERLRVGGRFEALFFVDAVEGGFQLEFDLFALRLRRFDRQFDRELADDVVVADGDFDVRPLDRLRQFALGFFEFAQRQRPGRFQLRGAGRVFGQLDHRVDRAGDLEVAADLRHRGAADFSGAFVFEVLDELRDLDAFRRLLTGGDAAFGAALLLGLFEARLEEAEGGRIDFVGGAFVFDEGTVGEHRQLAVEVDLFALGRALGRRRHLQLRQFVLRPRFERAGELDVEFAAFFAFGLDVQRQVEFAALHAFEAGFFDDLLRVFAAVVAATAPAGGEDARQRRKGREQRENSDTAQEMGLLVIEKGTGPERILGRWRGAPLIRPSRRAILRSAPACCRR
jgi:hypothetical protein